MRELLLIIFMLGFTLLILEQNRQYHEFAMSKINTGHKSVIEEINKLDKIKREFMSSIELAKKNRG